MVEATLGALQNGNRCAFINKFIVIVPVPLWSRVGVRLVGKMLVSTDFGTSRLAAEVMNAIVETLSII